MSKKIILCIDDTPSRYEKLSKMAGDDDPMIIVCCRLEEVTFYLEGPYQIHGICLDHDMPVEGTYFARQILPTYYPVAITSANLVGARNIAEILSERSFDSFTRISATLNGWETRVIEFFNRAWEK